MKTLKKPGTLVWPNFLVPSVMSENFREVAWNPFSAQQENLGKQGLGQFELLQGIAAC